MVDHGMSAELADAVIATMRSPLNGHGSTIYDGIRDVIGLKPNSYAQWAQRHRTAFAYEPNWTGSVRIGAGPTSTS
jgi:hypothetical protein